MICFQCAPTPGAIPRATRFILATAIALLSTLLSSSPVHVAAAPGRETNVGAASGPPRNSIVAGPSGNAGTPPPGQTPANTPAGNCSNPANSQRCSYVKDHLDLYNVSLWDVSNWNANDLELVLQALGDIQARNGWPVQTVNQRVTTGPNNFRIVLSRQKLYTDNNNVAHPAVLGLSWSSHPNDPGAPFRYLIIYDTIRAFRVGDSTRDLGDLEFKVTVVHEMTHMWDYTMGSTLSGGMNAFWNTEPYVSEYASTRVEEDCAEAMTTAIYPWASRYVNKSVNPPQSRLTGSEHRRYVFTNLMGPYYAPNMTP